MYSSWSWSSLAYPIPYPVRIFSISLSISIFFSKRFRKGSEWPEKMCEMDTDFKKWLFRKDYMGLGA